MSFARLVGLRFLRPKRRQVLLSVISLIALTGVAVGVAALIVVLAVMTGFQDDVTGKILGTLSHLVVTRVGHAPITDWPELVRALDDVEGVVAATPFLLQEVMLTTGRSGTGVILRGIDVETAGKVTAITNSVEPGALDKLGETAVPLECLHQFAAPTYCTGAEGELVRYPGIILGENLMNDLLKVVKVQKGRAINPLGDVSAGVTHPSPPMDFTVAGSFTSGFYEFDSKFAYIDLKQAQKFFDLQNNEVLGIEIKVADIWEVNRVARAIQEKLGYGYRTQTWQQMNRNLFSALKLEKLVMFLLLGLIVFVASLNIFSVIYMVVMDKRKSIAMLRAMGASAKQIQRVFMVQGNIIALIGTAIGVVLGIGMCLLQIHYRLVPLDSSVYYIDTLPMQPNPRDVLLIALFALGFGYLATILPARIASRMDPVKTLRYE